MAKFFIKSYIWQLKKQLPSWLNQSFFMVCAEIAEESKYLLSMKASDKMWRKIWSTHKVGADFWKNNLCLEVSDNVEKFW